MIQSYSKLDFKNANAVFSSMVPDIFGLDLPAISQIKAVAFGSCFALNFANALRDQGGAVCTLGFTEDMNTPFANLVCLDYYFQGENSKYYKYYQKLMQHGDARVVDSNFIYDNFKNANLIVFTAGVGSRWISRISKEPSILPRVSDLATHYTDFPSVDEQERYFHEIYTTVRKVNYDAPIIFTLSPVPLQRDFSYKSIIQADCVSKSILRSALHQFFTKNQLVNTFYYPTFEFFRWVGSHAGRRFFGGDGKARHPDYDLIKFCVNFLLKNYTKKQ